MDALSIDTELAYEACDAIEYSIENLFKDPQNLVPRDEDYVNEGFADSIKSFFQKLLSFIVTLFQRVVSFFRMIGRWIMEIWNRITGKKGGVSDAKYGSWASKPDDSYPMARMKAKGREVIDRGGTYATESFKDLTSETLLADIIKSFGDTVEIPLIVPFNDRTNVALFLATFQNTTSISREISSIDFGVVSDKVTNDVLKYLQHPKDSFNIKSEILASKEKAMKILSLVEDLATKYSQVGNGDLVKKKIQDIRNLKDLVSVTPGSSYSDCMQYLRKNALNSITDSLDPLFIREILSGQPGGTFISKNIKAKAFLGVSPNIETLEKLDKILDFMKNNSAQVMNIVNKKISEFEKKFSKFRSMIESFITSNKEISDNQQFIATATIMTYKFFITMNKNLGAWQKDIVLVASNIINSTTKAVLVMMDMFIRR